MLTITCEPSDISAEITITMSWNGARQTRTVDLPYVIDFPNWKSIYVAIHRYADGLKFKHWVRDGTVFTTTNFATGVSPERDDIWVLVYEKVSEEVVVSDKGLSWILILVFLLLLLAYWFKRKK